MSTNNLAYEKKTVYAKAGDKVVKEAFEYAEDYKKYLDAAIKTLKNIDAKYCNYVKIPIIEFRTIDLNSYISGFFIWPSNELDLWHTLHSKWIKIVKIMNEYEKENVF